MKALMIIPMPCDGKLFFKVANAVAKRWEADHPGKTMSMDHFQTLSSEFGPVTVIWDEIPPDAPNPEKSAVPASREVAHAEIDDRVDPDLAPGAKRVYDALFPEAGRG